MLGWFYFISHVYTWVGLWSWLLLKTKAGRDQKGQEGYCETEKLAGMSWTFAMLPRTCKCFIGSAWHGPVSHRILRGPSETSLWGRVPASHPSWLCATSGRYSLATDQWWQQTEISQCPCSHAACDRWDQTRDPSLPPHFWSQLLHLISGEGMIPWSAVSIANIGWSQDEREKIIVPKTITSIYIFKWC